MHPQFFLCFVLLLASCARTEPVQVSADIALDGLDLDQCYFARVTFTSDQESHTRDVNCSAEDGEFLTPRLSPSHRTVHVEGIATKTWTVSVDVHENHVITQQGAATYSVGGWRTVPVELAQVEPVKVRFPVEIVDVSQESAVEVVVRRRGEPEATFAVRAGVAVTSLQPGTYSAWTRGTEFKEFGTGRKLSSAPVEVVIPVGGPAEFALRTGPWFVVGLNVEGLPSEGCASVEVHLRHTAGRGESTHQTAFSCPEDGRTLGVVELPMSHGADVSVTAVLDDGTRLWGGEALRFRKKGLVGELTVDLVPACKLELRPVISGPGSWDAVDLVLESGDQRLELEVTKLPMSYPHKQYVFEVPGVPFGTWTVQATARREGRVTFRGAIEALAIEPGPTLSVELPLQLEAGLPKPGLDELSEQLWFVRTDEELRTEVIREIFAISPTHHAFGLVESNFTFPWLKDSGVEYPKAQLELMRSLEGTRPTGLESYGTPWRYYRTEVASPLRRVWGDDESPIVPAGASLLTHIDQLMLIPGGILLAPQRSRAGVHTSRGGQAELRWRTSIYADPSGILEFTKRLPTGRAEIRLTGAIEGGYDGEWVDVLGVGAIEASFPDRPPVTVVTTDGRVLEGSLVEAREGVAGSCNSQTHAVIAVAEPAEIAAVLITPEPLDIKRPVYEASPDGSWTLDLNGDGIADVAMQIESTAKSETAAFSRLPTPEAGNQLGTLYLNIAGEWTLYRYVSASACT
ncbi:MAG: hypothetical protein KC912_14150 [Proteobacteria bacterium]|nr:hypothetical protein [Pseudomonadota bacterium]